MNSFHDSISGYKILRLIDEIGNMSFFNAVRKTDGKAVIIKMYKPDHISVVEWNRCKQEYEIICRLKDIEYVINAYGIEVYQDCLIIILEDFAGEPLKILLDRWIRAGQGLLSLDEFFILAIKLTEGLRDIHAAHIIHKDFNSNNIIYNRDKGQIKIAGFHISTTMSREYPAMRSNAVIEGTLAYIAPEQTGRMNRVVDYRSDLYSLGATFYELLTGRPPFESDDPLALVHSHIAKIPQPVVTLNPAVPRILSDIVMRLLAKNAEDRYQSAYGLEADLKRCQAALNAHADVRDIAELSFELGMDDYTERFHIPQKLYGRDAEMATLSNSFQRIACGSREMVLLAGHAGAGMSALAAELHTPVAQRKGYFLSGKFDQYKQNTPYTAFTRAFNQLAELILMEPEEILRRWRDNILKAVDGHGTVLTEIMPGLEKVIGVQPVVSNLTGQENRSRINLIFQYFIREIATAEHPLVMFIDNLQWADMASLELIKALMYGEKIINFLLIGAYRDNEVDQSHPLMAVLNELTSSGSAIQTIELGNLQQNDVSLLIQETILCTQADSHALAEIVYNKTHGNVYFTRQILQNLFEEGRIRFDFSKRRWIWDISQIKAQQITDNVVDLMTGKLGKFSRESEKMLQLAACIGNEFNLKILALIGRISESAALEFLLEPLADNILIPMDDYYKFSESLPQAHFRFLHDRVQQAAYARIPGPERQNIHSEIAKLLLNNTPAAEIDQQIFDIVQHYNEAGPSITDEAERLQAAGLNMRAAEVACGTAAFSSAQVYLERALKLMPGNAWINQYDTMLKIHSQLAYVLSLTGDYEQLEQVLQTTEKHARTVADTARAKHAKIHAKLASGLYKEAVDLGLNLIKDLGVPISRDLSPEEAVNYLRETAELFTEDRINSLRYLPEASVEAGLIFETAMIINASVFTTDVYLSFIFVSQLARLCLEQGLAPWAVTRLVTFAMKIGAALHDIPKTRLLTDAALQLYKERYPSYDFVPSLNLSIGFFIAHRYEHLKYTLPVLEEVAQKGLATGAVQHACTCAWCHVWHNLFLGVFLENLEKESIQVIEMCRKAQMARYTDYSLMIYQISLNLQGKSDKPWIFKSDYYDEEEMLARALQTNDFGEEARILFCEAWLHYMFGLKQEAADLFRKSESHLMHLTGTYVIPQFYFYDTLANAAVFDLLTADEQIRTMERINRNMKEFEYWVRYAPMNHQHKKDLMEAEKTRLEGHYTEAATLFKKAIQGARDNEFLSEEALSFELSAVFYSSRGQMELACLNMIKAHDCYFRWQAWAKVQDIEKCYPQWFMKPSVSSKKSALEHLGSLDLRSVMKASQAISGRIILDELLIVLMEIVIENAGAQRGCLILEKDGKWVIEAEGTANLRDMTTLQAIEIEDSSMVCASIVRYVIRSHKNIVLDDAGQDGPFIDDTYIQLQHIKSVLCMPLLNRGRLSGILYLENNLATGVFTPERIEILELLGGQAAVALENAMLYQQAQQEIAERKLAEAALRESEERFRTIFDSVNDSFLVLDAATGDILDVNHEMTKAYGCTREEALNLTLNDISSGEPNYTLQDALQKVDQAIKEGPQLFEWHAKDMRGRLLWVEVSMKLALIGGQDRILVMVRDISERKNIEEALRESEARYKAVIESQADMVSRYLPNTILTFVNDAYCRFFGKTREELIGQSYLFMITPEYRELVREETGKLAKEGGSVVGEYINYRYDGKECWIQWAVQCITDEKGQVVELQAIGRDITERKMSEEALRESENKFRDLSEKSLAGIFLLQDNIFKYVNDRFAEIHGFTANEIIGQENKFDWVHPDDRQKVLENSEKHRYGKINIVRHEFRVVTKDGEVRHVEVLSNSTVLNGRKAFIGICLDITERKRAEAQIERNLRETRVRYEVSRALAGAETEDEVLDVLIQQSGIYPDAFVTICTFENTKNERDAVLRRQDVFKSGLIAQIQTGTRLPASVFTTVNLFRPDQPFISKDISTDERIDPATIEAFRKTGVACHAIFPLTAGNEWIGYIGVLSRLPNLFDEEKQHLYQTLAEQGAVALRAASLREKIRESQQRLSLFVQESPLGVIEWNMEFKATSWNPAAERIFGYTYEEALNRHASIIVPEQARPMVDQVWQDLLAQKGGIYSENENITKDKRIIICEWFNAPLVDPEGRIIGVAALVQDITERKRAEVELARYREHLEELVHERTRELESAQEELLKRERLAVLGQLTATVSHELRNPLGVIRSSAFYLKEKVRDDNDKIRKHLDRIEFQVDICNWIVEELLEYTRGSSSEMKEEDIVTWLENRLEEIGGTGQNMIIKKLPANLPKIFFDPIKFSRVITNLTDNAIHAVKERKDKGEKGKGIYQPKIRVSAGRVKGGVEIIIKDNGIGMDDNTIKRAFDPLFTTKARGTGLGLAIVKKIVEEHGGKVTLESKPYRGTKVILWLPVRKKIF